MEETARLVSGLQEPTVDAISITTPTPNAAIHLDDGVHLTIVGQKAVAAAVVATLAQLS